VEIRIKVTCNGKSIDRVVAVSYSKSNESAETEIQLIKHKLDLAVYSVIQEIKGSQEYTGSEWVV
jgi:hypothetical protein